MPKPDAATFEHLASKALTALPSPFREHLDRVVIQIDDFADSETLKEMGIDDRWELTGLYHGRSLDQQSVWDSGELPPVITLYRQPLLREWRETGVELEALITHVVVHEVGHHFGLSDAEMEAIEGS